LTLKATFHHTPAICRRAFKLIASGKFRSDLFITGHAPLAELNQAFGQLLNRGSANGNLGNLVKTAILPRGIDSLAASSGIVESVQTAPKVVEHDVAGLKHEAASPVSAEHSLLQSGNALP
jgi:hypothetical protein